MVKEIKLPVTLLKRSFNLPQSAEMVQAAFVFTANHLVMEFEGMTDADVLAFKQLLRQLAFPNGDG